MKVTDLDYALENRLIEKLDIMIERCTKRKKDVLLINEGAEGEGKTNSSLAIAYYIKSKTGRQISMFFRLHGLLEFAKRTEEQIIIWDEPALDSLSTDWYKEINKLLIRLLMTCRKKKHFLIFNFVRFYKFSEYIVVDRAVGLIHMFSRRGVEQGRFFYIKQEGLEPLYLGYRYEKKRKYRELMAFGGAFPRLDDKIGLMGIIIEGKLCKSPEDYEHLKDEAIESIGSGSVEESKDKQELAKLKKAIGNLKCPIKTREELSKQLGIAEKTIYNWRLDVRKTATPPVLSKL